MSWGYRIICHRVSEEVVYGVHEVYDGKVWTEDPVEIVGEDLTSLKWQLEQMLNALHKPVLEIVEGKLVEPT